MSKPTTLEEAIREFEGDIVELDRFLFPDSWELSPHQVWTYRKLERHPKRWMEQCRGSGKSSLLGRYFALKKIQSRRRVVYSGPSYRQSKHPFRYEKDFILNSPWLSQELAKPPTENTERSEILFRNGSSSVALPASGPKIHGQRADDLVITETFEYPKELYVRTVKPMLMGGEVLGGRTVTWETSAGIKGSFAYQIRNHVLRAIESGDPDYCFISVDFDQLRDEGFISERTVREVEADREFDEAIWKQQYMNLWLALTGAFYEWSLLSRTELKRAELKLKADAGLTYVVGGDVAWSKSARGRGADSALTVWEVDRMLRKPPSVVFVQKWASNMLTDQLAREWAELLTRFNVSLFVIDASGAGAAVIEKLAEYGYVEPDDERFGRRIITPFPHSSAAINETHHALRGAFEMDAVWMPEYPEETHLRKYYEMANVALMQLCDLETETTSTNYLKFDAPPGRKKDVAYSFLYGYYGVRQILRVVEAVRRDRGSPIVSSGLNEAMILGDIS